MEIGYNGKRKEIQPKFKDISAYLKYYRYRVVEYVRWEVGVEADEQQREILEAYVMVVRCKEKLAQRNRRMGRREGGEEVEIEELSEEEERVGKLMGISIRAPKGTGKTTVLAWIIQHFMCFFGKDQKNLMTAPKYEQLTDNLFPEVVKWISKARETNGDSSFAYQFLGEQNGKIYRKYGLTKEELGNVCVTLARTSRTSASESEQVKTLDGYHSTYQIIGSDEAYSVKDSVYTPLTTTMTREVNFAILIGNPTTNHGYAADTWGKNASRWWNIQMTAERSRIVTKESMESRKAEYADFPNLLRVYYYGLPPLDEEDSIFRFDKINECMEMDMARELYYKEALVLGVDVGMGGDLSAVCVRQGMYVHEIATRSCKDTNQNEEFVEYFIALYRPTVVIVDMIGVGRGVYDNLYRKYGPKIRGCVSSDPVFDKQYLNKRSLLAMTAARHVNSASIRLPKDDKLRGELNIIRMLKDKTKIQIEGKVELRRRGIKSYNEADSLMYSLDVTDESIKHQQEVDVESGYYENEVLKRSVWSA